MDQEKFTYLLKHPETINKDQTALLENIILSFPYFQSARAIYLKGLKSQNSYKYNQTLKITAAYTTDRNHLFNFITSPLFNNTSTKEDIKEEIDILTNTPKAAENSTTTTPPKVVEIGSPLSFQKNEAHSFNEWLQLNTKAPIKRKKTSKFDIIDKFIATNPKIKPLKKEGNTPPPLEQSTTDYSSLMTETLAHVYLEQKKYENAIKAYRILSLKYPEKSSFFANQIKAIENLVKK